MSEIHNSDIRELLDAIPVIPNELMAEYLTRQYQVSKNMAQEIIYNACRKGSNRRPACYPTKEGLAKADYITMTSRSVSAAVLSALHVNFCRRVVILRFPAVPPGF